MAVLNEDDRAEMPSAKIQLHNIIIASSIRAVSHQQKISWF